MSSPNTPQNQIVNPESEITPQSLVNRPTVKPGMSRAGYLAAATLLSVAAFAPGCVNTVQAPCPPSPCVGPDAGPPKKSKLELTPKKTRRALNKVSKKTKLTDNGLWEPRDLPQDGKKGRITPSGLWEPINLPRSKKRKRCPSDDDLSAPLDLPSHCRKRSGEVDNRL